MLVWGGAACSNTSFSGKNASTTATKTATAIAAQAKPTQDSQDATKNPSLGSARPASATQSAPISPPTPAPPSAPITCTGNAPTTAQCQTYLAPFGKQGGGPAADGSTHYLSFNVPSCSFDAVQYCRAMGMTIPSPATGLLTVDPVANYCIFLLHPDFQAYATAEGGTPADPVGSCGLQWPPVNPTPSNCFNALECVLH